MGLNARPIISRNPVDITCNPLMLEGGTSNAGLAVDSSSLRARVEAPLRSFTQRLLKRDTWLLVFYSHLVVLYAISALWLASGASSAAPDCLDMHMKQWSSADPEKKRDCGNLAAQGERV